MGEVADQAGRGVLGKGDGVAHQQPCHGHNGIEMKHIMIMLSTPVVRTMPP